MKYKYAIPLIILCTMLFPTLGSCDELTVFSDAWNSKMNPLFEQTYHDVIVHDMVIFICNAEQ